MTTETKESLINLKGYFKNRRLEKRGNYILSQMEKHQKAILNQFCQTHSENIAASRFFKNASVS